MMMEHNDLVKEMQHIDKLPVTERVTLARKRRKQQLATYNKWAKTDVGNRKSKSVLRKGIRFSAEVQLLETAARAAADKGAIDEMRQILKSGLDPNQMNHDGLTALHQACIDGSLEMVTLLLKAGANVNIVDRDLWTPLHAAATCGHFKIVTTLIKAGANLIAVNGDGDLPYDITEDEVTQHYLQNEMTKRGITQEFIDHARQASHNRMKDDIDYLIENGGNINQPLDQGGTLLHTTIANGFNELTDILLENGADVTARDMDGWEPIHVAAYWCNDIAIETLAEKKEVNLRALTDNKETPYDLCDDPELKISILQMISDRPEKYKFGDDAKSPEVPFPDDSREPIYGKLETSQDDQQLFDPEIISENQSLTPEKLNSKDHELDGNARKVSSDEEVPLNPLLNLKATELSERRNSVKEAKHMAPMKRMNSIENGNVSKISPHATSKGSGVSGNEKDKNVDKRTLPDRGNLEPLSPQSLPNNQITSNANSGYNQQQNPKKQPQENSMSDKENVIPYKDHQTKRPFQNENPLLNNKQNGNVQLQVKPRPETQVNDRDMESKKLIHIPRKKNPAPLPPQGSLFYLKRQRQEARELELQTQGDRMMVNEGHRSSPAQTIYAAGIVFDPPPSPTMIRYHYKMMPDEVVEGPFIREKKCSIM